MVLSRLAWHPGRDESRRSRTEADFVTSEGSVHPEYGVRLEAFYVNFVKSKIERPSFVGVEWDKFTLAPDDKWVMFDETV